MDTQLLNKIETPFIKNLPKFDVGDTIAVHSSVREGDKTRVQVFKGIILAIKGSGTRTMFTIRKISQGIGVEKIFPMYSPTIEKIEVLKRGKVRRSKIYYMRDRIGKRAMKIAESNKKYSESSEVIEDIQEEAIVEESTNVEDSKE
jgi:large subunit ribosomal protein L19